MKPCSAEILHISLALFILNLCPHDSSSAALLLASCGHIISEIRTLPSGSKDLGDMRCIN
ncbi:hypothetical protein Mapa_008868 [Marchantia paleacea]|nr:hypothetical protein Mapa_008868 [Marchantia paleacea]